MKNSKHTKQALLASMMSLVLCVAMLIGTTFAWFTDSVTTGKNTIQAGNLDIALYEGKTVDSDQEVDENTNIFDDIALWEPGMVVYKELTVANAGSLALKYRLSLTWSDYNTITVDGVEYALCDVLKVAFIDPLESYTEDDTGRQQALSAAGSDLTLLSEGAYTEGKLCPADAVNKNQDMPSATKTYGIVIYWEPGNQDNMYNVNNGKNVDAKTRATTENALYIDLGISLIATQVPYEYDSFDNQYDDPPLEGETFVKNQDELMAAIENGGVITFQNTIEFTANDENHDWTYQYLNNFHDSVYNLDGWNLYFYDVDTDDSGIITTVPYYAWKPFMQYNSSLVINGPGSVTGDAGCVEGFYGSNITINGGTFNVGKVGSCVTLDGYVGSDFAGAVCVINDGAFHAEPENTLDIYMIAGDPGAATASCTINGGTFDSSGSCIRLDGYAGGASGPVHMTINGGEFTPGDYGYCVLVSGSGDEDNPAICEINGGTFHYDPKNWTYGLQTYDPDAECWYTDNLEDAKIIITGGTFVGFPEWDLENFIADGYKLSDDGSGNYTVVPVSGE